MLGMKWCRVSWLQRGIIVDKLQTRWFTRARGPDHKKLVTHPDLEHPCLLLRTLRNRQKP